MNIPLGCAAAPLDCLLQFSANGALFFEGELVDDEGDIGLYMGLEEAHNPSKLDKSHYLVAYVRVA